MPRYFFHVFDGRAQVDSDGLEFPSLDVAKVEAQRFAGELIRDTAGRLEAGGVLRIEVADEADITLFHMQFTVADAATPGVSLSDLTC